MSKAFKLPDLGEGIHEGEVVSVLVTVGDTVSEGDPILEVETDKAAVEIPSPFTGTVKEIIVKPGEVVKVGDVLMTFDTGEEKEETGEKTMGKAPTAETVKQPHAAVATPAPQPKKGPVPASPATRRLARELGVDLHAVTPTGPAGLVTADDVRAHAARAGKPEALIIPEAVPTGGEKAEAVPLEAPQVPEARPISITVPPLPDFSKWGPVERIPVRSVRRATVRQMALSWSQIPHVQNQDAVDITELEAFRQKHKADVESAGGKLTLLPFVMKALITALKAFPDFNASLDMQSGEIIRKHYYHIGVAVDTEDGLLVPVIRDVDRKSITELSIELKNIAEKARERKITLEEMQGATFTITNAGPMGGGYFAPIINYPQVAILGMGMARMQPVVDEKTRKIAARLMLPIILCFDHRITDGADAIRFMQMVMRTLKDPENLLLTMI